MAIHSARRWWRKQCQKETRAHNATVPRKREAGGSAQDQQPYFIAASAWLRGVEKAVAEKFKQACEQRAADDHRKDDADEVAKKAVVWKWEATELAKKRRKQEKQAAHVG